MAARIIYWLAVLGMAGICFGLIAINDKLAKQNIALIAERDGPQNAEVEVMATPNGNVLVVVDGVYGHIFPGMCSKMGYRSL